MKLTFTLNLITADGAVKKLEEVTKSEYQRFVENATARLTAVMSDYFTQNLQEYAKI